MKCPSYQVIWDGWVLLYFYIYIYITISKWPQTVRSLEITILLELGIGTFVKMMHFDYATQYAIHAA